MTLTENIMIHPHTVRTVRMTFSFHKHHPAERLSICMLPSLREINTAFDFIYLDTFDLNQSSEIRQQETVPGCCKRLHLSLTYHTLKWHYYEVTD